MGRDDSALTFPCDFPIKAMGLNVEQFEPQVIELIRRHASDFPVSAVSTRLSKGDKYMSVTVTICARSQQQLDAIYRDLTGCEAIIMAL